MNTLNITAIQLKSIVLTQSENCHNNIVHKLILQLSVSSKTLMVLEGCAEPNLGCCILLRGAPLQELVRVKKIVKFMLLACYNWKLEKAFLGDIEAILPEPGMTFEDDNGKNDVFSAKLNETDDANDKKTDSENPCEIPEDSSDPQNVTDSEVKTIPKIKLEESSDFVSQTDDPNLEGSKVTNDPKLNAQDIIDDPLLRAKQFVRKTESDKTLSCGVPIRDFSDPLRSTLSVDDDVFLPKVEAKLKAEDDLGDR